MISAEEAIPTILTAEGEEEKERGKQNQPRIMAEAKEEVGTELCPWHSIPQMALVYERKCAQGPLQMRRDYDGGWK